MATNIFKLNDIEYECEFKLSNPDNQQIIFTKAAIRGMELVDDFFDPFMSGTISIVNPFGLFEQDYVLRGDGRDVLSIKFKPKEQKGLKDEEFEQEFILIDNIDTVDPLSRSMDIKTFTIEAIDAIKFMDSIPYGKVYEGYVGDLIKEIFIELLGSDSIGEQWASGDFYIKYHPPATFRYMDLLRYFIKIFYAKSDDIHVKGFISKDNKTKKYSLTLLSDIFKNNKSLGLEAFPIGDMVSEIGFDNENNPQSDPEVSVGLYISPIKNLVYNTPLYNWSTEFFINSIVYGYDPIMGQQKAFRLNFDEVRDKWEKIFVEPFRSKGGKPKPFAVKNKAKDKIYKKYVYPYRAEDSAKIIEAEIHNSLTFYNLQLSFSNIGSASRKAGRFIDIVSASKPPEGELPKTDQKLLGRWFVTQVKHQFFDGLYTNQVFATKTYIGPKASINEEID
jgi:hypothetical protein